MARKIFLYNTLGRRLEEFVPINPKRAGIYTCGPTVYSYAHIGNLRAYLFADVLRRTLEFAGYPVKHVMNITDVGHLTTDQDEGDDKLELAAAKTGRSAWHLATYFTKQFFADMDAMRIKRPTVVCKATDHIPEQIRLIQRLEAKGFVYRTSDGLYFDSGKFPLYGELALIDAKGLRAGIRVEPGEKRRPTDFALWKFSLGQKRQMEWDSPWGIGFPGWHIECSAMSMKYLGDQFDIHTGGVDHIPVHHTNEIAQSEAATGKRPFVRYWLHEEFLSIDTTIKMSKSSGETLTLRGLQEKGYDPLDFRFLLLSAHYRGPQQFRFDLLDSARTALNRLRRRYLEFSVERASEPSKLCVEASKFLLEYEAAVFNDLNLPEALSVVWKTVDSSIRPSEKVALLNRFDVILGLELDQFKIDEEIPEDVRSIIREREEARRSNDWMKSDELRNEILSLGYSVKDTPRGPIVERHR